MSETKKMSSAKIKGKQPELRQAMERGLFWTVIKKQAEERWPELPKIIQEAGQVAGQVHNGETHFELLANIHALSCSEVCSKTGAVDWDRVAEAAKVTESRVNADIPSLCTIVQHYGGGQHGLFIRRNAPMISFRMDAQAT